MHSNTEKIFKILPSLRRYALALSGTESQTDDVLESAIKWMVANSYLDLENFEGFGIVGCKISWLKAELNETTPLSQSEAAGQRSNGIKPTDIAQALTVLSKDQHQCLMMSLLEDKSYSQISALENIPASKVGDHLTKARSILAKRLFADHSSFTDKMSASLEWCSNRHLNALLDNELSPAEASRTRKALGFDQDLANQLEELALVDTLVVSNSPDMDPAMTFNPVHNVTAQQSAYLH